MSICLIQSRLFLYAKQTGFSSRMFMCEFAINFLLLFHLLIHFRQIIQFNGMFRRAIKDWARNKRSDTRKSTDGSSPRTLKPKRARLSKPGDPLPAGEAPQQPVPQQHSLADSLFDDSTSSQVDVQDT